MVCLPRGVWVDLRTGDPAADDVKRAVSWGPNAVEKRRVGARRNVAVTGGVLYGV
jgi:hypothetical protein